ncbi:Y-family DNA polymerase [Corticibacter populi]|uniref:Y-family DNA polymerase n=1 Tax=Corticibacter populi TaxID=1550736 RepID=UPI001A91D0FE|nr:DNA polymerase IV [Corticibacter populi]
MRRIAHLDMDAFFASVELLRQPQLKGLPLVVGGGRRGPGWLDDAALEALPPNEIPLEKFARLKSYVGRGVITTATYEARQFGIGSAMGMMKAAQLCPEAYRLPADFDEYRRYSRQFKHVITAIAPVMEDRGIDEVYIDFTDVPGGQREGGRVLARLIQKSIFEATGLTCSIGVAPNKLLAKMASEFNKPHGISILHEEDLQTRIWPLPCRKINGIGPKSGQKLEQMDIHSIGELAAQPLALLIEQFGKSYGAWLHAVAWGRDDRPLETESEPVSMSRETTFERDLHAVQDRQALSTIFSSLCERVAADLQRKGYVGRTIGIKIRYGDFRIATRAQSIDGYTSDVALIRQVAGLCLKRVDLQRRFRLLGVKVDGLRPAATPGLAILSGAQQSGHKKARQDAGPQLPLDFG